MLLIILMQLYAIFKNAQKLVFLLLFTMCFIYIYSLIVGIEFLINKFLLKIDTLLTYDNKQKLYLLKISLITQSLTWIDDDADYQILCIGSLSHTSYTKT
jgi:hypothetical protein